MLRSIFLLSILCIGIPLYAQSPIPGINISIDSATSPQQVSTTLQIVFLLTVLTMAPAILIMTTSFTRFVIVLSFLRQAIGTPTAPSNQVVIGLALFLSLFVMMPVWEEVNTTALDPYLQEAISQEEFMSRAALPIKRFMGNFTREKDLALFIRIAKIERPKNIDEVPIWVMIPAFVISELKAAFQIGFLLYVPFLVIDMVVASILMAMGMMMMPPVMISLPFKLMLFVLVDGWHLILGSMVKSFVDL
ncbi:MAG: flagellar type III secretion system pore protein FliP [SAR324 cluster bacterium]|nr:flagellar type III secretion system pore protein FliP [SAR324 cluster bacterium]MED5242083.1 flagellar type III secretion system pore protein FliP [SAR324 cluster bacterium]